MVTLLPEQSAHSHLNPLLITLSMVGTGENCSRPQRNNLVFCAMLVLCCCSLIIRAQNEFRFLFEIMFVYLQGISGPHTATFGVLFLFL